MYITATLAGGPVSGGRRGKNVKCNDDDDLIRDSNNDENGNF